nr:E3 ubiquitin-protein ligase listerin [Tanacetum cinerariifolium]
MDPVNTCYVQLTFDVILNSLIYNMFVYLYDLELAGGNHSSTRKDMVNSHWMASLSGAMYGLMLRTLPAYVKEWFNDVRDRPSSSENESFTRQWCSPPLIVNVQAPYVIPTFMRRKILADYLNVKVFIPIGLMPSTIQEKITSKMLFPPVGKLDPLMYQPPELDFKKEHIISRLNGMSVQQIGHGPFTFKMKDVELIDVGSWTYVVVNGTKIQFQNNK